MNKNKYAQDVALDCINDKMFNGYYSPIDVLKNNTPYILTYGGRNVGKTFGWLLTMYAMWQKADKQSCYMRRMADNILSAKCSDLFTKVFNSGIVENIKGYAGITYRNRRFCGYWMDEKNKKTFDKPFCFTYALSSKIESNKGVLDIENLGIVFFDEALTADNYLSDEFIRFQNAVSTIIRENDTACIVLCANTVSWVAPYFREFCIKDVRNIKQGTIKVVQCSEYTSITVEYCNDIIKSRKKRIVDKRFFGFKNGTAKMITSGSWELKSYPHLTREMLNGRDKDLVSRDCYIDFENDILVLELFYLSEYGYVVNVRPTYDIDYIRCVRVYTDKELNRPCYRKKIFSDDKLDRLIWGLYKRDKFFYADNLCGEIVRKYLQSINMI